ncbi:hypothetical protein [Alcanivorax sp.]|uniref:hypothetical protein n=1 Tax=Alcanivorax sp. TaxID=1872427 RepID=UPI00261FD2A3|nr:hypothetical protein [Alcanivorax sp.]
MTGDCQSPADEACEGVVCSVPQPANIAAVTTISASLFPMVIPFSNLLQTKKAAKQASPPTPLA